MVQNGCPRKESLHTPIMTFSSSKLIHERLGDAFSKCRSARPSTVEAAQYLHKIGGIFDVTARRKACKSVTAVL